MKANDSVKKNKVIIILVLAFICVFSITGVLFANGMFDVKGRKFVNLLTKEQYVMKIIEACKEEYYNDIESNYSLTLKKSSLAEVQNFLMLENNNLQALFKIIKGENVYYFAVQKEKMNFT